MPAGRAVPVVLATVVTGNVLNRIMSPLEGHFTRKNVVYELKESVYDPELYSVSVFLIRETLWISFLIFKQHLI